VSYQVIWTNH